MSTTGVPAVDPAARSVGSGSSAAGVAGAPEVTHDPHDPRRVHGARGLLGEFNAAGVLEAADVHVARRLGRLGGEADETVLLAVALAVRAVRLGSVCVDLAAVDRTVLGDRDELVDVTGLPWPEPVAWTATCVASPLIADGGAAPEGKPLRLVDGLLYLERYWADEELVRLSLTERAAAAPPAVDLAAVRDGIARHLGPEPEAEKQRQAAAVAALRRVTVLAGGPGTGKTTTVAGMLAMLLGLPGNAGLRIALAAPTGKAATRLQEAVSRHMPPQFRDRVADARTLHRLLGWRPGQHRFAHDRTHRLPFDVVVVDETSMVSLPMMARLLDAVRPDARLVLVGDPDQLASVEAGAVLGDLARADGAAEPAVDAGLRELGLPVGVRNGVVTLDHVWRFDGAIAELAAAVQRGDADATIDVLRRGDAQLEFAETGVGADWQAAVRTDVVTAGRDLSAAATAGRVEEAVTALELHRVLCAHRRGPFGVTRWTAQIDRWLTTAVPAPPPGRGDRRWVPGRAVLVTANDYDSGLFNGDTGVVVATADGPRIAFARGGPPALYPPARLPEVTGVHAMTVHRGQGSQFSRVSVVLPPAESPLLTRELLYTAVTRARHFVRVVGTEEAVRAAVARPVARASGLRHRLNHPARPGPA